MRRDLTAALIWLVLVATSSEVHAKPVWKEIERDQGVTVFAREEPKRSLPTFRGVGEVSANIYHLMAIILDNQRAPEWVDRCESSRQLERYDARTTLVYSRASSPWPVSDRDTVVRVTTRTIRPQKEYRLSMRSQPDLTPRVDGVVRIEQSHIYFHLTRLGPKRTQIEYSLNVDPGGYLPKWLVRMSTRTMPIKTIRALEAQARKTHGQYKETIQVLKARP